MDVLVSSALLAALVSALVLFSVHRQNRLHAETLAHISNGLSKEAHAANHLYTRKAMFLEEAYHIIGDLYFWAEKCVVPATAFDFGSDKDKANKMIKAFEDFRLLTLKNSPFIHEQSMIWGAQSDLMVSVNHIHNMVNSNGYKGGSPQWQGAVNTFQDKLLPLASAVKEEVRELMQFTETSSNNRPS
ncbi:MAG: hypothetical protein O2V44_07715 [Candidatus Bathyarchaeota archaeon]|nr:hypothetical protein [Candidatus Bathyarchaeota archaeon]